MNDCSKLFPTKDMIHKTSPVTVFESFLVTQTKTHNKQSICNNISSTSLTIDHTQKNINKNILLSDNHLSFCHW